MHAGLGKNDSGRVQISGLEKTSGLKKTNCMQKLSTFLLVCRRPDEGPSPL